MKELLAVVEIPNYVRKVLIANARRPTYYTKKDTKIPKKYVDALAKKQLFWVYNEKKKETFLCHIDGSPVIKNSKSAGTPRYLPIRGNDLHRLTLKDFQRSKIIKAIKEQMIPYVSKLEPIPREKYPLRILMEIHTTKEDPEGNSRDSSWDVDNHGLWYAKVFPDVLCGCPYNEKGKAQIFQSKRIIEDDNASVIIQPPTPLFKPIENYEDRKLVFKIYSA